jgi:hypothetical protein
MNYKKDYKSLMAIISFLATTNWKSGTYVGIAASTSLEEVEVKRILEQYKEFFVKVPYKGKEKANPYFTLHLRYGLRRNDPQENIQPLPEEYTLILFNFISQRIIQEENASKTRVQNIITMVAASIAAVSAIIAAILSAN